MISESPDPQLVFLSELPDERLQLTLPLAFLHKGDPHFQVPVVDRPATGLHIPEERLLLQGSHEIGAPRDRNGDVQTRHTRTVDRLEEPDDGNIWTATHVKPSLVIDSMKTYHPKQHPVKALPLDDRLEATVRELLHIERHLFVFHRIWAH